jgi:hypothetical protein
MEVLNSQGEGREREGGRTFFSVEKGRGGGGRRREEEERKKEGKGERDRPWDRRCKGARERERERESDGRK